MPSPPAIDPRCNPADAIGQSGAAVGQPGAEPAVDRARAITPLTPARLVDTRPGAPDDGVAGRVGSRRVLDVGVAGRGGVPPDATGAVLNVTIVEPCADGFAIVYPAGAPNPRWPRTPTTAPSRTWPDWHHASWAPAAP